MTASDLDCSATLAALARGGADVDWARVELHLQTCPDCAAGLDRFTTAIEEQFAASRLLIAPDEEAPEVAGPAVTAPASENGGRVLAFPTPAPARRRPERRLPHLRGRLLPWMGAAAAALVVLVAVGLLATRSGSGSATRAVADRRAEFVPILEVLPERPDHTYHDGDLIQVHIGINQPSRIVLSVLEGHATTKLLDVDADKGERYVPYRIANLRQRATLRIDVYYGQQRVAREEVTLLPAASTPAP
jgi:hypothetical protein